MRILHIVGDSKWGGGGHIILALARMARDCDWGVDVLATDPVSKSMLQAHGVGVVDLDVIWREIRPVRDTLGLLRLQKYLEAHSYDLVHTHTSKAGFVGRIAARRAGIPAIIHTAHSFPFHEDSGALAAFSYRHLERHAAHYCDCIVTVSEYHRQWGLRWKIAAPEKIVAIPNGISENRLAVTRSRSIIRNELGVPDSAVFFLTPGRLFKGKGLEYLLDAIPHLSTRLPGPFRIVLAGEGSLRGELERRIAQLAARDRVIFAGFRPDIANLLNACDIVVLPSLHEGMSIALLEAMAMQRPIVATSIGGNLEPTRNGEGALIVPPRDARALAEAMAALVEHADLAARKARDARRLFLAGHTEEVMAEQYRQLYAGLLSLPNRKHQAMVS